MPTPVYPASIPVGASGGAVFQIAGNQQLPKFGVNDGEPRVLDSAACAWRKSCTISRMSFNV
jgi:hypothetical protein